MQSAISEITLRGLASNLGKEWRSLATHLGVRKDEVDRIEADNQVAEEQIFQMLMSWWQRWDHQMDGGDMGALDALCHALTRSDRLDLTKNLRDPDSRDDDLNLDLCRAELIRFYKEATGQVPLLPWVSSDLTKIEDIFVELKLMENKKKAAMVLRREIRSYEEMLLLQFHDDQLVRNILLCGVAGSGKTTIVSKIAYDWTLERPESPLSKFRLLITLNMRELKSTTDLIEAIFDQILPEDTAVSREFLRRYLKSHGHEVLIILDGMDEFCGGSQLPTESYIIKIISSKILRDCTVIVTTRPHMVDKLSSLNPRFTHVESKGFSDGAILQYIQKFFQDEDPQVSSQLYAILMENDNLHELARLPMLLLVTCLVWSEDQKLPETLTGSFKDAVFFIMKRHFRKLGKLDGSDEEFLDNALKELVQDLGKAALEGLLLQGQKLVFEPADFGNSTVVEKACKVGILSQERVRSKLCAVQNVTFIHKTFQEAIAGFYLANLAESDEDSFNHYLSHVGLHDGESVLGLEYLLRFCCGASVKAARTLLRHVVSNTGLKKKDSLLLFLLMHLEAKSEELHSIAMPLFETNGLFHNFNSQPYCKSAFEFLIMCASQSSTSRQCCTRSFFTELKRVVLLEVTENDLPVVISILKHALNVSDVVLGFGWNDECIGKETNLQVHLGRALCQMASIENLSIFPSDDLGIDTRRKFDLSVVVEHLAVSGTSSALQVLVLQSTLIGSRHLQMLHRKRSILCKLLALRGRPTPPKLLLDGNKESLPPRSLLELETEFLRVGCFATSFGRSVPQLQVLQLLQNSRQIDIPSVNTLLSKAPHLQVVDLSRNEIGDAFSTITQPLSQLENLKELILSETGLSSDHAVLLTKEVLPFLVNLQTLSLSYNTFSSPEGLLAVVQWSCTSSSLQKLFLGGCVEMSPTPVDSCVATGGDSEQDHSMEQIKIKMQESSTEILDVQVNYLGKYTSQLMRLLKRMPALKTSDMRCMGITDSDAVNLAESLACCNKLQQLHLEGNVDVGNSGIEALLRVLQHLPDIQLMCLPFNDRCKYSDTVRACLLECQSMIPGHYVFGRPQIEAVIKLVKQTEGENPAMH